MNIQSNVNSAINTAAFLKRLGKPKNVANVSNDASVATSEPINMNYSTNQNTGYDMAITSEEASTRAVNNMNNRMTALTSSQKPSEIRARMLAGKRKPGQQHGGK